jgi:phosphatidylglycerophosphate synthase
LVRVELEIIRRAQVAVILFFLLLPQQVEAGVALAQRRGRRAALVVAVALAHQVLRVALEQWVKVIMVEIVLLVPILEQAAVAAQGQLALLVQEAHLALEV